MLTGTIKKSKAPGQDRLKINRFLHFDENSLGLNQEDFYTELKMQGYQYSEDYKGILKSSIDGTRALIKWNENWAAFIDSTLQLFTFSNNIREVKVPLTIRKIIIDTELHESATRNTNGKII